MKELSLEKMEKIEGGCSAWDFAGTGVGIGLALVSPVGPFLFIGMAIGAIYLMDNINDCINE
tara:strand:- start:544 stop:729 length:186 start_codon:yes stop_codon:yes gene_type:complete